MQRAVELQSSASGGGQGACCRAHILCTLPQVGNQMDLLPGEPCPAASPCTRSLAPILGACLQVSRGSPPSSCPCRSGAADTPAWLPVRRALRVDSRLFWFRPADMPGWTRAAPHGDRRTEVGMVLRVGRGRRDGAENGVSSRRAL